MSTNRYVVNLDWYDGDDSDETDVDAESLDEAARKVWEHWSVTGWTGASLREGDRYISLDLDAKTFEEAVWDSSIHPPTTH